MIKKLAKNRNLLLATFFVTIISNIPYMNDYLLCGDDVEFHLGRIEGLAESISMGNFLGRLNPVNGFGYASGIMYPQLFLYIPAILKLLGFSLLNSYKIFVFMIHIATFLVAYISFKGVLCLKEDDTAILAGMFYTLGLYRLINIYVRAALGEVLGMAFLPLLFWGMYELFEGDCKRWWIAVIGWTCILQSHILTVEIALGFSIIFFVFRFRVVFCKERIITIFETVILIALLNAFFIVPFIHYSFLCDFQIFHMHSDIAQTAVSFSQMFSSVVSDSEELREKGVMVGKTPVTIGHLALITIFVYIALRMNTHTKYYKLGDTMFLFIVITLLAVSDLFPWEGILYRFPFMNGVITSIQFLYRLFAFVYLFLSIIFMINIYVLKNYFNKLAIICVVLLLILQNCWYYMDSIMPSREVLTKEQTTLYIDDLYLYNNYCEWKDLNDRGEEIKMLSSDNDLIISNYDKNGSDITFQVEGSNNKTVDIEIPLYYYPTYVAQLNGEKLEIEQGNYGVIRLKNISQDGEIRVWFPECPLWLIADAISVCTVLICLFVRLRGYYIKRQMV